MSIFKCKMCGGTIEFVPGTSVGVCDSCGTKQTLPRIDDEKREGLYNRANQLRRNNEFDKAASIYEQILNEDTTDAEAYWSLVLCQYGIEYVEDPVSHKRVPTVNRVQFTSIFDDDNYKSAIMNADGVQQLIYEEEAKAINDIQKEILVISQKEDPFDIFICYKESDSTGRRTQDSVLANDLYHQLTQEGFKVFFARITLEDKLGTAYEPYIFAALNSAKVMVVLGTKPEYFSAVWVRNEWSRFLSLVKKSGGKKVLIPAYKDMDPYNLPEEFSHLQALDMSKLGFMQDLIRGIKKIVRADESRKTVKEITVNAENTNVSPILKRAFIFLEDGNWGEADAYCEKVLDQDPENARAYLGKLMAEMHVHHQEDFINCELPFENNSNYQKVIRFGDEKLASVMKGYVDQVKERKEGAKRSNAYDEAIVVMNRADSEADYKSAEGTFRKLSGFKNADELADQCADKAEECRRKEAYITVGTLMQSGSLVGYESALEILDSISGVKDADELRSECQEKICALKEKEEAERLEAERKAEKIRAAKASVAKVRKKIAAILIPVVIACIALAVILFWIVIPKQKYAKAKKLLASKDYEIAYSLLKELGKEDEIRESKSERAEKLILSGEYDSAYILLEEIGRRDVIADSKYSRAIDYLSNEEYEKAYVLLEQIGKTDIVVSSKKDRATGLIESKDYEAAYVLLEEIGDYETIKSSKNDRAAVLIDSGNYEAAYTLYQETGNNEAITSNKYDRALVLFDSGDFDSARKLLEGLNYKDSESKLNYINVKNQIESMASAKVGDYVFFGSYEQDNITANGIEEIEWLVVEKKGNKILLLSKYALDCQPFNKTNIGITWENCTLRTWLNDTFLNSAFNPEEQAKIMDTAVTAHNNRVYGTPGGKNTTDKVFLLSQDEVISLAYFKPYFAYDGEPYMPTARDFYQCQGTKYCVAQGAKTDENGNCCWWLRTPGDVQNSAVGIYFNGYTIQDGIFVDIDYDTVRPAVWINLEQ